MKDVRKLLAAAGLSDWRVAEREKQSYELFFVHEKLETVRSTDAHDCSVTVYVDHDGARGDSSFAVSPAMTEAQLKAKIDSAAARAKLVFNQPYELPGGGTLQKTLPSDLDRDPPEATARKIAETVFSAAAPEGASLNALEIFLDRVTTRVSNSRGVAKEETGWRAMIEAIPTFTDEKGSVELYEDYRFTTFEEEKLQAEIAEKLREVRDRALAGKPETPMKVNVILRPKEIAALMEEMADDLSYGAAYQKACLHKPGDDLQEGGEGDKITLTLCGILEGSEDSSYFDEDGLELTDTAVIEGGKVKANHGSSRFGQYLGVKKPSGVLPCMRLAPGTLTEEEEKAQPYLECVSLSGLQVELFSDYIGGEIRLAYYFDGKTTRPVTGITMSGSLSEVLKGLRLSGKTERSGAYEGPVRLLMKGMTVL